MVFTNQDRVNAAAVKFTAWIESFSFKVRHVRFAATANTGGSMQSQTPSINELLDSAGPFSDTVGADNKVIVVADDMVETLTGRWKFYFGGAADLRVLDKLFVKRDDSDRTIWADPPNTLDDYDYKLEIDEVHPQSGGNKIAGWVVYASLQLDNTMDDYVGV